MRISDWSSDVCSSDLWVGEAGPLTDVTHPELTTDTLLIESSCRVGGGEVVTNTRSAGRASAVADDEDSGALCFNRECSIRSPLVECNLDRKSTRLNSSH